MERNLLFQLWCIGVWINKNKFSSSRGPLSMSLSWWKRHIRKRKTTLAVPRLSAKTRTSKVTMNQAKHGMNKAAMQWTTSVNKILATILHEINLDSIERFPTTDRRFKLRNNEPLRNNHQSFAGLSRVNECVWKECHYKVEILFITLFHLTQNRILKELRQILHGSWVLAIG